MSNPGAPSENHPARLFDREHPLGRPVQVRAGPAGVVIDLGDESRSWPYAELRQSSAPRAGEQARLERAGSDEVLMLADARALEAIRRAAPEAASRVIPASRVTFPLIVGIVLATFAALAVATFVFGIPAVATSIAHQVPVAWETEVGDAMLEQLAPPAQRITDPRVVVPIEGMVERLAQAAPSPYRHRVVVVDRPEVNAFAAPGGRIAVFRGLIEFAKTPEELASVLAHEMAHVRRRHVTAGILKDASLGLLVSLVFGDIPGAGGFGLEMAKSLGRLSYSRAAELEADADGFRAMVAAGIDPSSMPALFARMAGGRKDLRWTDFLASHPASETRAERLRALLAEGRVEEARPLVDNAAWRELRGAVAKKDSSGSVRGKH